MYDDSSFYGDMIVGEYDEQNNFMNPESPFGFLVYHFLGDGFDKMSDMCTEFMNDFSILTASAKGLDKFWGVSYNMPRPKLYVGSLDERYLTDDEYRVYLYLRNCQLLTREDIEINMNKAFGFDDYTIYFSQETNYLTATDHLRYTPTETERSNIGKNIDDTSNDYFVKFGSEDDTVHLWEGNLSTAEEVIEVVNIPFQGWDSTFLEFLEQYISVKGNLKLKEYSL